MELFDVYGEGIWKVLPVLQDLGVLGFNFMSQWKWTGAFLMESIDSVDSMGREGVSLLSVHADWPYITAEMAESAHTRTHTKYSLNAHAMHSCPISPS